MPTYRYNKSLPTGFLEGEGGQIVKDEAEYARLSAPPPAPPTGGDLPKRYAETLVNTVTAPPVDKVAEYYDSLRSTYKMPDEARRQALRGEAEREVAGQLSAIDQAYMTLIADERARQAKKAELGAAQVGGIGRLSGLGGSSVQSARQSQQMEMAQEAERQATQALAAKQAYERAQVMGGATESARQRFEKEQELALQADVAYGEFMQGQKTNAKDAYVEVGGVLIDPVTKAVIYDSRRAEDKEAKTYTLSAGQKVYDATGRLIAENPAGAVDGKMLTLSPGEIAYNPDGSVFARGGEKTTSDDSADLLSPTEAAALGVPYGTTKGAAAVLGIKPLGDMNTAQQKAFEGVTTRYQADPVISNVRNSAIGASIADRVIADPKNAANQLSSLYILVKALDPNSAVREGEIALAEQTQSYLSKWGAQLQRVSEGVVIPAEVAVQLAQATRDLFTTWQKVGDQRTAQYKAQAQGLNVGPAFNDYLGGFASASTPINDIGKVAPVPPQTSEEQAYVQQQMNGSGPLPPGVTYRDVALSLGIPADLYARTATAMGGDPVRVEAWLRAKAQSQGSDWASVVPKAPGSAGKFPTAASVTIPKSSRLAFVNNNPGNLRLAGQRGAVQGEGGFARFPTPQDGYLALYNDLRAKQTGNTRTGLGPQSTLGQLIAVYAPPSENNTPLYVQQAAQALGISPNTPIGQIDTNALARFVAKKESSTVIA